MRGVIPLSVVCLVIATGQCAAQALGPTITFSLGIHHQLAMFNFGLTDAEYLLARATKLYDDARPACNDTHVCLTLRTDGPVNTSWSSAVPLDVLDPGDSSVVIDILSSIPTPQIKVVNRIQIGQTVFGGMTALGTLNALIDDSVDESTWAHEFGHMCGLPDRANCNYNIMKSSTAQFTYAISPAEAVTINSFLFNSGSQGTVHCDATGIAAIEEITAIPGPGGVEFSFFTDWEQSGTCQRL